MDMKVSEILARNKKTLSIEVFPPKTSDSFEKVRVATESIAAIAPAYMSVTYGAGGTGSKFTLPIAENIEKKYNVPVIHHLTCVGSSVENIKERLDLMHNAGIENVLALRGDIPDGEKPADWHFKHASDLVSYIKDYGDFCIGGACYPEGHPEAASIDEDLDFLKLKVDMGCDFLTTQLFLDNAVFYRFYEKALAKGINVPITAGIMPITSIKQFGRIESLSGSAIPDTMRCCAEKYADDPVAMRRFGLDFATLQIADLYNHGFKFIHLHSMNSPEAAIEIGTSLSNYFGAELFSGKL